MGLNGAPMQTERLLLREPREADADGIFRAYASDPEVTRYVGWPRHRTISDTRDFLSFSIAEWRRWPCGPRLMFDRHSGELLGSTGLAFESRNRAATGYVISRSHWGMGYASEALSAMVLLARRHGLERLYALTHAQHTPSRKVLERAGFTLEELRPRHIVFPNVGTLEPQDVCCYSLPHGAIQPCAAANPAIAR